jgi:hypothetical protein
MEEAVSSKTLVTTYKTTVAHPIRPRMLFLISYYQHRPQISISQFCCAYFVLLWTSAEPETLAVQFYFTDLIYDSELLIRILHIYYYIDWIFVLSLVYDLCVGHLKYLTAWFETISPSSNPSVCLFYFTMLTCNS